MLTQKTNHWHSVYKIAVATLVTLIALYVGFVLRSWIGGADLVITTPKAGDVVHQSVVAVTGTTQFIARVFVNGYLVPISIHDNTFTHTVALPVGLSTVEVDGYTKSGAVIHKTIPLYYLPETVIFENKY